MTSNNQDSAIFENAPIGLLYTEDRIMRRLNHQFAELFGYSNDELEDQSLLLLYPTLDDFDFTGEHWLNELRLHGAYSDERIMRRKSGELFWCRVWGQTFDASDPLARAVWSFFDLSSERAVLPLSRRERQVGMLLVEGLTAKLIARRLGISPRTVHVHKSRLMTRFGVSNSLELVRCLSSMPQ